MEKGKNGKRQQQFYFLVLLIFMKYFIVIITNIITRYTYMYNGIMRNIVDFEV